MNILVLVKQVPDTTAIKIDPTTNTIMRAGVASITNPDDLAGIEEALKLKELHNATVTTITMGPEQASKMIHRLYARGIDDAYLLTDKKFAGSDTWSTSWILSTKIKKLPFDLIIAGYQAIDGDTAQVGPQVAEFLDIPQVTHVTKILEVNDSYIIVEKKYETETHTLKVKMPCLITTLKQMNTPRLMRPDLALDASKKDIHMVTFSDLDISPDVIGLKGSPTKVKKTYTKEVIKRSTPIIISPSEAAKKILAYIK